MTFRPSWFPGLSCSFLLLASAAMLLPGCGKGAATKPGGTTNATTDVTSDDGSFSIPDGTPREILEFASELQQKRPQFKQQSEMLEYVVKTQRTLMKASDKVLKISKDDGELADAVRLKFFTLIGVAAGQDPAAPATKTVAKQALESVNQFREDPRKAVADAANEFWIAARALNLVSMTPDERTMLIDDAVKLVTDSNFSMAAVRDASFLTDQLSASSDVEASAALCERLGNLLVDASEPRMKSLASIFRGKAARLRLPGGTLELSGKLIDGGDLDWASYRGKVVLIDFWATWCRPCLAELPNVEASFAMHHKRGFEIIGISLDSDRKALQKFLDKKPLPWVQMFEEPPAGADGWQHPMAEKYGISQIPATILVDQQGKVAALDLRGEALDKQIARLLDAAK
ncbi:TlpA family protein disulfide reductase [Schlesneria paludicola]|uniref:TlpA family protein disulfide reductase n=1 Tax=Schlesneria paludicola TaxID=360056 RepID=UPI00029B2E97|nr:TlpA disulfide reductase family protein [Schlesneria paludicola]